ncbi:Flp family type IVb pilin [uncultured Sphingomonas sp.]|uniref:Flp family type IVb pilin n=1 Tax=uncultured Sphingomonas sp. TaxID=158754 RepID=UPI0025FABA13|nr:Flp family type IVb pilin [uncultured Sphingomonas sp.]
MKATSLYHDLRKLCADTRGASAVEYGLLLAGIMLMIFAALSQLGSGLEGFMTYVAAALRDAIT